MRELRLVGIDEDGTHLVLHDDRTDTALRLAVDERLHAALRGDRARLGQLEIALDSRLTPREIQHRVRAGDSVPSVAQAAAVPVDRVMRFAAPVLAEREHVAGRARRAGLRRSAGGDGSPRMLEDAVVARLLEAGLDADLVAWDSWRREDGRWAVTASWDGDEDGPLPDSARFVFDIAGRSVVPDDEGARWVCTDEPAPGSPSPARLSVVGAAVAEHVPSPAAAGDPLAEALALAQPERAASDDAGLVPAEIAAVAPGAAPAAPHAAPHAEAGSGDGAPDALTADPLTAGSLSRDPLSPDPLSPDEAPTVPVPVTPRAPHRSRHRQDLGQPAEDRLRLHDIARHVEDSLGPEPAESDDGAAGATRAGRNARPSVPSWDEIMFGRRRRS